MPRHVSARATGRHHLISSRLTHWRTVNAGPMSQRRWSQKHSLSLSLLSSLRLIVTPGEPGQTWSSLTVTQLNENGIEESSAHKQSGELICWKQTLATQWQNDGLKVTLRCTRRSLVVRIQTGRLQSWLAPGGLIIVSGWNQTTVLLIYNKTPIQINLNTSQ